MTEGFDLARWGAARGGMSRRIAAHDWAATPFGPVETWPPCLRQTVDLMLDHCLVMAVLWGPEDRVLFNDPCLKLLGEDAIGGLGQPLQKFWPQSEDGRERLLHRVRQGRSVMLRDRNATVAGRDGWFDIAVSPLRGVAGSVDGALVTVVETTSRVLARRMLRAQHRRQGFLVRLSDALRALPDALQVTAEAQRMLGKELRADGVSFGEAEDGGEDIRFGPRHASDGVARNAGLDRLSCCGTAVVEALAAGRRMVLPDVAAASGLSESEKTSLIGSCVRALVAVPILDGGWLAGCLAVHQAAPRALTADEIFMIEETAARTWSAMERARAERALVASEELFRSFAQNSDSVLWISPPDHSSLQFLSPSFEVMFGETRANLLADPGRWTDLVHPEDRATVAAAAERLVQGISTVADYRILRPADGQLRYIRDAGFPVLDGQGRITQLAGIATDVTELRGTEANLRASEESQRAILETAQDYAILTMDASGRIETWSKGAETVLGWTAEEIIGQPVDLTFTPEDRSKGAPAWELSVALEKGQAPDVRWHLRKDGSRVFIEGMVRPQVGRDGKLRGFVKVGQDVTDRRATLQRLQASETLFRQFAEASTSVIWIMDAQSLKFDFVSAAFEAVYGARLDEVMGNRAPPGWEDIVVPEDRKAARQAIDQVRAGARVSYEFRISRPSDGEVRWIRDTVYPLKSADGRVERFAGIAQDVTELKLTEAELLKSAERFRSLVEGIPQLVWRAASDGAWTWASPQWTSYTGQTNEQSQGWGWLDPVHPEDRAAAKASWGKADEGGVFQAEYRVRDQATEGYRWFQTRAMPARGPDGAVVEWLGTSTDVQDLRAMQARLETLVAEVQHRTRNLMSVISAVTDRTLATSTTLPEFSNRIRARLGAVSRANGLLSRLTWDRRVTFAELLRVELAGLGVDPESPLVSLSGPQGARLRSSTVQTLAICLHELVTNALTIGALAAADGRLAVHWTVEAGGDGSPLLRIDWVETGELMPAGTVDAFAREMIVRALPYQFSATTSYARSATGLQCSILLEILPEEATD